MRLKLLKIGTMVLLTFTLLLTGFPSITAYAFDNSVKEGTVVVVFYLKDIDVYVFEGDDLNQGWIEELQYGSGTGFFVGADDENPQL